MDKLDQSYLTDLVLRSRQGDSNAFAELYAATDERIYGYLCRMLPEEGQAAEAMAESMILTLRALPGLMSPDLYLPWVCRTCFTRCVPTLDGRVKLPFGVFPLAQLMQLPLAESQVLLMRFVQGLPASEVEDILNFSPRHLRKTVRAGRRRLELFEEREPDGGDGAGREIRDLTAAGGKRELDTHTALSVLEQTFTACGWEPNTVPLEALASYATYRKERFTLQRGIVAAALAVFFILPALFVEPRYEIREDPVGERGLPVYTITLQSRIPPESVTARMRTRVLPVYEVSGREYTVEPTRNGELTVEVRLRNRQTLRRTVRVRDVDSAAPRLTGSRIGEDTVQLTVRDDGIGVDFREILAVGSSGARIPPLRWDAETGEILFPYPEEDWEVYIPDHIGNTLHLALTLDR